MISASARSAGRNRPLLVRRIRFVLLLGCALAGLISAQAQAAPGIRWHKPVRLEPASDGGVQAVSCPSGRLCVAVDASGHVLYSRRPSGGAGSWSRPAHIDRSNALTGVSCPTIKFCVAVDDFGNVLTSTHPTKGTSGWSRPVRVDSVRTTDGGPAGLLSVSCPTTTLCVAVDGSASGGGILSTTRPRGGAHAWHTVRLGVPLEAVSCATAGLCVAAGAEHIYSTNPAGGRSAWHATGSPSGGGMLSAIDCPTTSLCVGAGFNDDTTGLINATGTPRGAARTWRTLSLAPTPPTDSTGLFDAIGCARGKLCVALDSADNAYLSSTPVRGWSGPQLIRTNPTSQQNAISCTTRLCVVVDSSGVETTGAVHG